MRTAALATEMAGGSASKSATPVHVLRNAIVAGSSALPETSVLVKGSLSAQVRERAAAADDLPRAAAAVLRRQRPDGRSESEPPEHAKRRVAVSVVESMLSSVTDPDGHHGALAVNVPSCWSCALCRPSKTS